MAYEKIGPFTNNQEPALSAATLNHLDEGIAEAHTRAMTPGPQGERGPAGSDGAKGDKGDQGNPGVDRPAGTETQARDTENSVARAWSSRVLNLLIEEKIAAALANHPQQ